MSAAMIAEDPVPSRPGACRARTLDGGKIIRSAAAPHSEIVESARSLVSRLAPAFGIGRREQAPLSGRASWPAAARTV